MSRFSLNSSSFLCALLLFPLWSSAATSDAQPAGSTGKPSGAREERPPAAPPTPSAERAGRKDQDSLSLLQRIRALTPEQRTRLIENIRTWEQLNPELKEALVAREKAIRKSLLEEMHQALEGSQLTAEQRDLFEKRYKDERRKLEASLKAEMESRRKAALEEMTSRLKKEVLEKPSQP